MLHGKCDPKFQAVADEFATNFQERGEVGASLCMTLEGESVLDLWGGLANPRKNLAWEEDTIGLVYSCTKGATALCAHLLVDRGALNLHAPVSEYWPEFGREDKKDITVSMMLNHSAGLQIGRAHV